MKKELALHFITTIILFVAIFVLRFLNIHVLSANLSFLPFAIGGIVGTILPDVDHLIYVYYMRPQELTSQRVMHEAQKGNINQSWDILSETGSERTNLVFHTIFFQLLFLLLSLLVISSSGSLLGRGLVLAFLLHILLDEYIDLRKNGNLNNWLKNIPIQLDNLQLNVYLIANFIIILIFGLVM